MHLMSEQEDISEARGGEAIGNAFAPVAEKLNNVLPEEKELINYIKEKDSIVEMAQVALKEATSQVPVESSEIIKITVAHMMDTASKLFEKLPLSKKKREESDLVEFIGSKTFHMWANAVIAITSDKIELAEHAIIIFLTEEYGYTKLRNALENAEVIKKDPDLARFLDRAQLQQWAEIPLDLKKVFKLLKLGEEGDKILERPSRQKWVEFIGFRKQNENPYELLIKILKEQHGNQATLSADQMLANILRSAVKNEKVSLETYDQFEDALLKTWTDEEKPSDNVYSLMQIENTNLPLESPFLTTWIQYMRMQDPQLDIAQLLYFKLKDLYPRFDDWKLAVTQCGGRKLHIR
ncbi:unnamed protein product [Peronospora belbahrii]|uniref:Uncharacterized protein n=1 Tax=Peronospora belbahrii TaxID=622444 RepID=A0ABN8D8N6_9STRA|nr:unnamed protein product [Peronospora belbahrii]